MRENMKNMIISISGTPVSGKGTTVREMKKLLVQNGYKKENIYVISTGNEFRNYFNLLIDFINSIGDDEKMKILAQHSQIQELFNNSKYRNQLEKEILKLKEKKLNNITVESANNSPELAGIRNIVDEVIDSNIKEIGKKINRKKRPDEVWIIDSRLAFSNIPSSFAVRVTVDDNIAAQRLFNDTTRGREDSNYQSIQEAQSAILKRKNGEVSRYKERYGVDLENSENYDLIINTSFSKPEEVASVILECTKRRMEDKPFGKYWTSPKMLLPLQTERETLSRGTYLTFEETVESIKEQGYIPSSEIETIEVDNVKYIIEGHHRNFAAAYSGKTLIPYRVIAKDDEKILGYGNIARERARCCKKSYLYGHENFLGKDFSYETVYPNIYDKLKSLEERQI